MSIYIKLEENKILFRNTKTNKEYTIIADKHFSHNGLLIANIDNAIEYLKIGIKQVMPKYSFIKPKIYLLPMKDLNEITQTEQHAIMEAVYIAGARELVIIKNEYDIDKKLDINKFGS
jgi:actin-like ATPase involved in cell morphogenesis